jgi:DNA repair protein RadC
MHYQHTPITQWALEDRPREKLMQRGLDAMTDAELVAILLGSGTRELSAIALGRKVLDEIGSLGQLARCGVEELLQVKGIGPAKAVTLVATFELGRRKGIAPEKTLRITSSESVANYLIPKLGDMNQEVFYVLFLNRNHEVKAEKPIFRGGVSATVIDPKVVFREAINHLASAIVIAHNHPSGNLSPSQADIQITRRLVQGGKFFDIRVLDHLVVSHRGYFSFADEGMME